MWVEDPCERSSNSDQIDHFLRQRGMYASRYRQNPTHARDAPITRNKKQEKIGKESQKQTKHTRWHIPNTTYPSI